MWHPQAFNPPPCSAAPRLQVLEAVVVLGISSTNASMSIIAVFITRLFLFAALPRVDYDLFLGGSSHSLRAKAECVGWHPVGSSLASYRSFLK